MEVVLVVLAVSAVTAALVVLFLRYRRDRVFEEADRERWNAEIRSLAHQAAMDQLTTVAHKNLLFLLAKINAPQQERKRPLDG